MKFNQDFDQTVPAGKYNFQFTANGGTATLQMKLTASDGFTNIPDGALSADSSSIIEIATCRMKAGLTGDATFLMDRV